MRDYSIIIKSGDACWGKTARKDVGCTDKMAESRKGDKHWKRRRIETRETGKFRSLML